MKGVVELANAFAGEVVGTLLPQLPVRRGRCRVCDCTEVAACEGGCSWVDVDETLCTACCPPLDRPTTRRGRR
jgi:hypothetical protein